MNANELERKLAEDQMRDGERQARTLQNAEMNKAAEEKLRELVQRAADPTTTSSTDLARGVPSTYAPQRPSVGRVVHYVAYGTPNGEHPAGVHRAATITEVYEDGAAGVLETVGLCVMNPTGLYFNRNVPHDETQKTCGSWHFPERV